MPADLACLAQCEIERAANPANGFARAGVKNHLSAMSARNFADAIGRSCDASAGSHRDVVGTA